MYRLERTPEYKEELSALDADTERLDQELQKSIYFIRIGGMKWVMTGEPEAEMQRRLSGMIAAWLVLCAIVVGAGGGFLLGYLAAANDDDRFLTPLELGGLFAAGGAVAGLTLGLLLTAGLAVVSWLRRR